MSYDPLEQAAKGATEAILEFGEEKIKQLVSKFRDRKIAFIQDEKTIQRVKEQYKSGELAIYKEYIKDKEILFLLNMGLTLRSLEKEKEDGRKRNLRTKILSKFDVNGLHIAQFVENGILNRYMGILIDDISSIDKFKKDIMEVLESIEKYVLFVQAKDEQRNVVMRTITVVNSQHPKIFILSGISSAAEIVRNCETRLKEMLKDYELEKISSSQKENLFFKKVLK